MPFEPSIIGAITGAITIAYKLYQYGFSKANSAHRLYREFGVAIKSLGQNLESIKQILSNAETQLGQMSLRQFGPEHFDLGALNQIVGDYSATLTECHTLILNNSKFIKNSDGFVSNIMYNFNVEPEAARLKERVEFHNVKMLMVLEPLEIKMISELQKLIIDLHQDQAERLEDIIARLDRIHSELKKVLGHDFATDPAVGLARSIDIDVPEILAQKFEMAISESYGAIDAFPVEEGLDAFFEFFKEKLDPSQVQDYLNLMKCVWIMSRLMERLNAGVKAPGSLYDTTVRKMGRKLRLEVGRIKREGIPYPDISEVLKLPTNKFQILAEDSSAELLDDEPIGEVVLDFVLPSKRSGETNSLRILRNPDSSLQIENKTVISTTNLVRERIRSFDFDPARVQLVPLYMLPEQNATVLKFLVGDGINGVTPVFKNKKDLLKFQQLVLGYEIADIGGGITTQYQYKNRSSKTVKLEELGKLQIWIKPTTDNASADSVLMPRRESSPEFLPVPRRISPFGRRDSWSSSSRVTGGSTLSNGFSAQTSTFSIGATMTASESRMPDPPLLVLFLKSGVKDSETFSFLCITLDQDTQIDPKGCECRNSDSCPTTVIRNKTRGHLSGHRFSTGDINDWNLAILGAYSRSGQQLLEPCKPPNLKIDFQGAEERLKFAENLLKARVKYDILMRDYVGDVRRLR